MGLLAYFYSSFITIYVTFALAAFLICYLAKRERKDLLLTVLFALYLISELMRILFSTLLDPRAGDGELAFVCKVLEKLLISAVYFFIILDQAGTPLSKAEGALLLLCTAAALALTFTGGPLLLIYVFFWGVYKLYPLRGRDGRTKGMLYTAAAISAWQVLCRLAGLFFSFPPVQPQGPYDLEFCAEGMLYIVMAASLVELVGNLKRYLAQWQAAKEAPKPRPKLARSLEQVAGEYGMSKRETEVFTLLVEGKSGREIGEALFISEGTVRVHIHNIYQKLGISSRREINAILSRHLEGESP